MGELGWIGAVFYDDSEGLASLFGLGVLVLITSMLSVLVPEFWITGPCPLPCLWSKVAISSLLFSI